MDNEDLAVVAFDKTGRIRVHVETPDDNGDPQAVLHTLRPATIGQFREVKDALLGVRSKVTAAAEEHGITDLENPGETAADAGLEDVASDAFADVVKLIFNGHPDSKHLPHGLSDHDLPDDPERWPVWLLFDNSLITRMIDHWRQVPLARS